MARAFNLGLTNRSGDAELPPVVVTVPVTPPKAVELLTAESDCDAWRIVELFSLSGLPFDVDLVWSSGGGSGVAARVTVARATRVAIHARSLRLLATNHAPTPNRVGCTVADGFAETRNQLEHRARLDSTFNPVPLPVPAFADTLRVDVGGQTVTATVVRIRDAAGVVRASYPVNNQPPSGIPVGAAGAIEVLSGDDLDFRAVFTLSL